MEGPLISILLSAYNAEKHIAQAMQSMLGQTYGHFELLVINDGSTDATEKIILECKDQRIRYIRNETNIGLIASLNRGIEEGKGEFIVRMDSDDISLPHRIEKQVAFMKANPLVGAAGCWYYAFPFHIPGQVKGYTEPERLRAMLLFNSCLCHPATILRKEILDKNKIRYKPEFKHAEDYDLWIQISNVAMLSNVPEFLFKYRLHKSQVTSVHNDDQKRNASAIRKDFLRSLGFSFTEEEFQTHTIISENSFITSSEELAKVEKWLLSLVEQNKKLKSIEENHFNFLMGKMWYDSCGITTLGISAYKKFWQSPLHMLYPTDPSRRRKLWLKCIFRRITK